MEKHKRLPEQAPTCSACRTSAAGYGLRHSCEPHRSAPTAATVKSHPKSFSMAYAFMMHRHSYSLASDGQGWRQQGQQLPKVRVHPSAFQPRACPTSPPAAAPPNTPNSTFLPRGLMQGEHSWPHSPSWEVWGNLPWWSPPVRCPQQHMDRAGVLAVGVLAGQAWTPRCVRHGVLCLAGARPLRRCPWGLGRPGSLLICDRRLLTLLCPCIGLARKPPYSHVVSPHQLWGQT